jgi:hypothetical protein
MYMPARAAQEIVSSCIAAAEAAAAACDDCAAWALQLRGSALDRCVLLALDCAEICRLTGGLVMRGSEMAESATRFCAEICDLCAQECRRHTHFHTEITAQRCHRCALACRRFAQPTLEPSPPVGSEGLERYFSS